MDYHSKKQKMLGVLLVLALGANTMQAAEAAVDMKAVNDKVSTAFCEFFDFKHDTRSWEEHMSNLDTLMVELKKLEEHANDKALAKIHALLATIKTHIEKARSQRPLNITDFGKFYLTIKQPLEQLHKALPHLQKTIESRIKAKYGSFSALTHFSARING